jgi:hypothetical protein
LFGFLFKLKSRIKLMLSTYLFPYIVINVYMCYICSFYSATNTNWRRPAMFTLVWYPPPPLRDHSVPDREMYAIWNMCRVLKKIIFQETIFLWFYLKGHGHRFSGNSLFFTMHNQCIFLIILKNAHVIWLVKRKIQSSNSLSISPRVINVSRYSVKPAI